MSCEIITLYRHSHSFTCHFDTLYEKFDIKHTLMYAPERAAMGEYENVLTGFPRLLMCIMEYKSFQVVMELTSRNSTLCLSFHEWTDISIHARITRSASPQSLCEFYTSLWYMSLLLASILAINKIPSGVYSF